MDSPAFRVVRNENVNNIKKKVEENDVQIRAVRLSPTFFRARAVRLKRLILCPAGRINQLPAGPSSTALFG